MKPGLRKIAALILASATLFGSGASVVSAAYADDTTMGRPTRIQAEPDVKTTTGGDEAATKPDTGSGDEAGTGADEQSGTGAPAQSAPQADAGQAAPDVTVHDMLDTDSATVSRLRLIDRITGTAPFDADNARGDDKDETNDIVRSYDTVTYDYEYTLTPDSTMDYYRRTRVGFRFELPYPKDKVTFDAEKMGWVDHTPGYEPKLTTETIDGIVTQVYTCYRLLEPTSQSPTVNPGTGFTFGRMDYSKPGTYVYTVTEQADRDSTIGYSTQAYDVTVTVADNGGMLSASADRQANDIRFDNTYTPTPVDVTVKADKHLTGRALNDGEFTAELKDMDGNTLQSKRFKRTTGSEAKADEGDGTLTFDKLTFDKTGIYKYTVDETDTQLGGVTYDTTSHTVTVTVTEDADSHTLTAKTEYSTENGSEDGIRFTNTYQPQNVLVELTARKRLTGRELKADEFEFELVDKTGKVIDTERNDKDGDIRFKPLEYARDNKNVDDRGEHRYVIREKNTGEKNVTYDRTEHHVTVTVGDDLQGSLTAKVEYDPTDDKTKGDAVGDKPSTTPGMVTVTGTRPEFNNSYIPPATPAIVRTIRQLAKTGVNAPTVALAAFTLLGVGLMLFRRRGNQTETARHRK